MPLRDRKSETKNNINNKGAVNLHWARMTLKGHTAIRQRPGVASDLLGFACQCVSIESYWDPVNSQISSLPHSDVCGTVYTKSKNIMFISYEEDNLIKKYINKIKYLF